MTADLPRSYTEHKEAAEQLLTMAHEVESPPKCHLAKTYALMSQAHTALAALDMAQAEHEFKWVPRLFGDEVLHVGTEVDESL